MAPLLSKSLGINSAKEFMDAVSVDGMNVKIYLAISHAEPWTDDNSPPTPIDTLQTKFFYWRDMIGGKKVTGNDVCLVVPRINWTTGTRYSEYTDQANVIFGQNFYVLSNTYNIYKCLDNNNGANSYIQPTYTSVNTISKESDGYIWKFMGTLNTSDQNKFLSPDWMPIRTLTLDDGSQQWSIQQAAIDGGLDVIEVIDGGTGYTNAANITITISGDGTGAVALANINTSTQSIDFVTLTNPGTGYHFANSVASGDTGSGANLRPIIPPAKGHGANMVEELGGSNVMINIQLRDNESGKISVQNDFRQVGLIKNPLKYGTSNLFTNSTFTQASSLLLSAGGGDYNLDEYVFQGGTLDSATFSGRVFSWDATNNTIQLTQIAGTPSSDTLLGLESGTVRFIISVDSPELVPYSGSVLYIENMTPVQRGNNQTENIQIVFSF